MEKDTTTRLKERINFLENILESLPLGLIVLDPKGRIMLTNKTQEEMSSVKRDELIGQTFHMKWKELIERTELQEHYWSLLNEKKSYDYVFHDVIAQFHDVKVSGVGLGAPLSDGHGFVLLHHQNQKIKEDKYTLSRLAQNLAEANDFLQNLVDSSLSAVFTVVQDGSIRSANKTAGKIFECPQGDLLWRPISSLFANKLKADILGTTEVGRSGVEEICLRKNGESFKARILVSTLQGGNEERQDKLVVITDISGEEILKEKLAVSEKLAVYSELIAGIFHQLNNPLVGVVNFSALLREKVEANDAIRPIVDTIHDAAKECQELISTLIKGFREPESTFIDFSLGDLIDHELEQIRGEHGERADINFVSIRPEGEDSPTVRGDELQLGQVFRNLLNNALQAMPEGGTLQVSTEIDASKHEVVVRFSDTGDGIPKENISKIFTPFFSTKKNTGGGLGLSFCFQAIKNHDGKIEVESTEGEGSSFTIVLPLADHAATEHGIKMNNEDSFTPTVLVVEDEAYSRKFLETILRESGCQYIGMGSIKEGRAYLEKASLPDLILLDIRLPDGNGLDFFAWICNQELPIPVIIMTAHGSIEEAVGAMKEGAYDFITKPFDDLGKIRASLKNALEHGRLKKENLMLRAKLNSPRVFQKIIGKSKQMEDVFTLTQKAARTKSNVLIEGGSGTGKELVAKAIHDLSDRKGHPFVPVNCGALPENLLESALFGHEKGAFTGADKLNKGFFEEADGGTLFLDEIGDAPSSVQVKILRAVEYGTIYRVGSTKPISINVRFLFATHKNLQKEIDESRFREDLFYRINVINIFLPPLEERRNDIPVLAQHFANTICLELGVEEKVFSHEVIAFLRNRSWPGNVRELKNFIERIVALHSGQEVSLEEVKTLGTRSSPESEGSLYNIDFEQARNNFEKSYFQKLINACHGDLALAVETSGVHKTTIYRKLKDHKIKPE